MRGSLKPSEDAPPNVRSLHYQATQLPSYQLFFDDRNLHLLICRDHKLIGIDLMRFMKDFLPKALAEMAQTRLDYLKVACAVFKDYETSELMLPSKDCQAITTQSTTIECNRPAPPGPTTATVINLAPTPRIVLLFTLDNTGIAVS